MDRTLTFKQHVRDTISKTQNIIKMLYPIIGRRSKLAINNKLLVFKQIFRPVLSYASPLIHQIAATNRKSLQIVQNKILKLMLNLPMRTATNEIHELTGIERLDTFMDRLAQRFTLRSQTIDNPLIADLFP